MGAPRAVPQWEAFAKPPVDSRLAEVVTQLKQAAEAGPPVDHPRVLYPLALDALEKRRPVGDLPREWVNTLAADRVRAMGAALKSLAESAALALPADAPDTLAAGVGMAAVLRASSELPAFSLERQLAAAADMLGPGVGAGEVERLARWVFSRMRDDSSEARQLFLLANHAIDEMLGPTQTTLRVTDDELIAVGGILDELRLGKPSA